jgi:hypothetical protein
MYIHSDPIDSQIYIPISLSCGLKKVKLQAMLDSGATTLFISPQIIRKYQLTTQKLTSPIRLQNIDQTPNVMGSITESVQLQLTIQQHRTTETFLVAKLGDNDTMIGIDQIKRHNPEIDWHKGSLDFTQCPPSCHKRQRTRSTETLTRTTKEEDFQQSDEPDLLYFFSEHVDIAATLITDQNKLTQQIAAGFTKSQAIAEQTMLKEGTKTFEEMVPLEFRQYKDTFSKKASERMPT